MQLSAIVKIAIAAAAATYVTPKIVNKFTRPELEPKDEQINQAMAIGVTGVTVAGVYTVLTMAMGGGTATLKGGGGAS